MRKRCLYVKEILAQHIGAKRRRPCDHGCIGSRTDSHEQLHALFGLFQGEDVNRDQSPEMLHNRIG